MNGIEIPVDLAEAIARELREILDANPWWMGDPAFIARFAELERAVALLEEKVANV